MTAEGIFVEYSCRKLEQLAERIGTCLGRLSDEQIWHRQSENENAVGNIVLHLCGNVRQWIGFGVGGQPDIRARDSEFEARRGVGGAELTSMLNSAVREALEVLRTLPHSRLADSTRVQTYDVPVLEAIYHVVEHFSGHAGQIIFATKLQTGSDLGFYSHLKKGRPAPGDQPPVP